MQEVKGRGVSGGNSIGGGGGGGLGAGAIAGEIPIIHYNYFPLYNLSMSCNYTHNSIVRRLHNHWTLSIATLVG